MPTSEAHESEFKIKYTIYIDQQQPEMMTQGLPIFHSCHSIIISLTIINQNENP